MDRLSGGPNGVAVLSGSVVYGTSPDTVFALWGFHR